MSRIHTVLTVCFVSFISAGCSAIQLSGEMTRKTGEAMSEYGNSNTGIIAAGARFGGKVNTAVGATVENIAKKKEGENAASGSTGEQFADANRQVTAAAVSSVSTEVNEPVNVRAQKRLQALGYNIGAADGTIGPKTKAALGEYQKKSGLKVTRSLDPPTLEALGVRP